MSYIETSRTEEHYTFLLVGIAELDMVQLFLKMMSFIMWLIFHYT